jgi:hypothetical protein
MNKNYSLQKIEIGDNTFTFDFSDDTNSMVNATEMCQGFPNFNLSQWLKTLEIQNLIWTLEKMTGVPRNKIVNTKSGRNGNTWVCYDLAQKLAESLSTEFYILYNKKMRELLTMLNNEKNLANKDGYLYTLKETAKLLDIGKNIFNKKLRDLNMLNDKNLAYREYVERGLFVIVEHPKYKYLKQTRVTDYGLNKLIDFNLKSIGSANAKSLPSISEKKLTILEQGFVAIANRILGAKNNTLTKFEDVENMEIIKKTIYELDNIKSNKKALGM